MKLSPWYLAALAPLPLFFVEGAMGAQIAVLGVTLGIFFGTLSLGKPVAGDASRSHSGN